MSNTLEDAAARAAASSDDYQASRGTTSSPRETLPFVDEPAAPRAGSSAQSSLVQNPHLRQFVKFCLVGASSTLVMFVMLWACHYKFELPLLASLTAAFLISCFNGFIWNRVWTFKAARGNSAHEQSAKFLAVNTVGYLLNTSIVVLIVAHFAAHGGLFGSAGELKRVLLNVLTGDKGSYPKKLVFGAQATAVCIVVWWNYFANRLWTFKH